MGANLIVPICLARPTIPRQKGSTSAVLVDRTRDLSIFSLTLSQPSYQSRSADHWWYPVVVSIRGFDPLDLDSNPGTALREIVRVLLLYYYLLLLVLVHCYYSTTCGTFVRLAY